MVRNVLIVDDDREMLLALSFPNTKRLFRY